jgi:hypothetical protein
LDAKYQLLWLAPVLAYKKISHMYTFLYIKQPMDIMKLETSGFFIWQNFAVFQPENTILADLKDFLFEIMALVSQILN